MCDCNKNKATRNGFKPNRAVPEKNLSRNSRLGSLTRNLRRDIGKATTKKRGVAATAT